jgi:hypothetical protein
MDLIKAIDLLKNVITEEDLNSEDLTSLQKIVGPFFGSSGKVQRTFVKLVIKIQEDKKGE